jgi:hypothetical protein
MDSSNHGKPSAVAPHPPDLVGTLEEVEEHLTAIDQLLLHAQLESREYSVGLSVDLRHIRYVLGPSMGSELSRLIHKAREES